MRILQIFLLTVGFYSLNAHDSQRIERAQTEHSLRNVSQDIGHIEREPIGHLNGQLRTMYIGYHQRELGTPNTYATAVGGSLNFISKDMQGVSFGAELAVSKDLNFATGERTQGKNNAELSSTDGRYSALSQVYLSYRYDAVKIQAGRILIDTPLADSDDITMIHNTFSGGVISYEQSGFSWMFGHLSKWQGTDAGLDTPWVKTAANGTNFGGVSYADGLEFNLWYYNITQLTNAFYIDSGYLYHLNQTTDLHFGAQYLNESQLSGSGVNADIYGVLGEAFIGDATLSFAYNYASKNGVGESSFSGFGGGTLYTSMDTMILNNITNNRSAAALVGGIGYALNAIHFTYAYGDFSGNADDTGVKAHIVEQDIIVDYSYKEFTCALTYSISQDRQSSVKTANDWERMELLFAYNF